MSKILMTILLTIILGYLLAALWLLNVNGIIISSLLLVIYIKHRLESEDKKHILYMFYSQNQMLKIMMRYVDKFSEDDLYELQRYSLKIRFHKPNYTLLPWE